MIDNILFINTGTGWGGLEKWHYQTALELKKRDYKIFILAKENTTFYDRCKRTNFKIEKMKHIADATFINPIRVHWLVKYLKRNNIDAVFLAQSSHFKYGSLSAKLAGVEKIIYRRALAKPVKNKFYNRFLLKYCISDFMSISKMTRDENLKNLPADCLPNEKIKLIYKGVKKDKFIAPEIKSDIRREFGIRDDELIIANIGRLCRQKAQQYLIEALPQVLEVHEKIKVLIIGGKGGKEELYKSKVKKLGVEDKVIFTGFREDIPSILKQIDFMVHTAIYEGGSPWVILEAMMAGVPIVTTKAITIPEFVIDGETGYLAEDKNPADIAKKIIKMINNQEREKMGERAFEIAQDNFSLKKMIDDIEDKILKR
ncbi:glycosyltransferase family 4 protein [Halocella sp. SP3-1]|uniref:glycosyltransferase family 4 protein n=1 Tax=Halocella sp. SP3-1 TaxID=2382161 RepID=UPI000F757B0A|nr:glycosyltransferase family 4 protein [Halocella sp. SP3-1]AZO93931.1 glycosyltransferase family 1 protein [Halocella sp. SP3-1]